MTNKTPLTLTACQDNCTVTLSKTGVDLFTIFYLTNTLGGGWHQYHKDQKIVLRKAGDYVQFANSRSDKFSDISSYYYFELTGYISASGNIQSLLNWSDECTAYCFFRLFNKCETLVHPPELPATKLAPWCYINSLSRQVFRCTYLNSE